MSVLNVLFGASVRVTLLLATALGAASLLRRQAAALRHWLLAVGIACAGALPLLTPIVPSWYIGLGALTVGSDRTPGDPVVNTTVAVREVAGGNMSAEPPPAHASDVRPAILATSLLGLIWIAGAALSLLLLIVGLGRLAWLASRARRVDEGRWRELATEIAEAIGLRRQVVLLQSDESTLLVTWGLRRPKIVLPAAARHWRDDRARIVLRHELAHIQRGDWVAQIVGELLRAIYWFNPIVWIACRRLRQESERACDDAVLNEGVDGAEYAAHLLDLARALHAGRSGFLPATAMARPSSLEGRISAMLTAHLNRAPLARSTRLATLALLASLTIPIAGAAAQGRFSTLTGTVLDQTNGFVPNATLVLTNTTSQARHEVRSDRTGRFEFVGLPSGDYMLEVRQPGFAIFKDSFAIARDIDRNIQLQIGSITETITVHSAANRHENRNDHHGGGPARGPDASTADKLRQLRERAEEKQRSAAERCGAATAGGMGGNILAPNKLRDVRPDYPEQLKNAQVGGIVTMEAVIGTDGTVRDVRVLTSPHPDLERSAVDAVRQWEFSSTFLNCTPVDVRMNVTVNFVAEP